MRSLADIAVGQAAIIDSIKAGRTLKNKLLDLGFIPGEEVQCAQTNPADKGTVSVYRIGSALFTMRSKDARHIFVKDVHRVE